MAFKILTNQRISALIEKLAPRFLGRDQDHLVAFADEIADASYDATVDYVEPLFDFRDDIQSPAGAAMVGILDAGGVYTGGSVEDALQEVPGLISTATSGIVVDSIADADTTHAPSRNAVFDALQAKADLASPTFTGDPKAPTPATADNDTSIATTAFVKAQGYATLASPTFTGDPKAPTPATADNDTSIATTAFVKAQGYALDSGVVHTTGNETITGIKTFNTSISSGAATVVGLNDVSRHYTAHTANGGYGIGVSTNALNVVAGTSGRINFIAGGSTTQQWSIESTGGLKANAGVVTVYNDFSKHIDLFSAVYGINITAGSLNLVSNASTNFYTNTGVNTLTLTNSTSTYRGNTWGVQGDGTVGYTQLNVGTTTVPGYLAFFTSGGLRQGYIGFATDTTDLLITAENNRHWKFNVSGETDWPTINAEKIGFRSIPRSTTGFVKGYMFATAAGQTVNSSSAGDTFSIYNDSAAAITLTQGAGVTMRKAGTATTGNLTLAARGIATLWFNTATEVIVSGNV